MEQLSEEWFAARLGKVSASRVKDIMPGARGYGATRKNYMMELLCQRLTGTREEGFNSAAMQRGTDLEPVARGAYEVLTGDTVEEVGFIDHPNVKGLGASPDGLIGDDGLIEIKCPNTAQHVACLKSGKHDSRYYWQMQCQMACTDRDWCMFVSFDDRLPEPLDLFVVRVERNQEDIESMLAECQKFLAELDELEAEMLTKIAEA